MVLDGLTLFERTCKTTTIRRTKQSCSGDDSPLVKLVTEKEEREKSKRRILVSSLRVIKSLSIYIKRVSIAFL